MVDQRHGGGASLLGGSGGPATGPDLASKMTRRAYYAAHAPITLETVCLAFGSDPKLTELGRDATRASFMAVWALMRFEYADAMLRQEKEKIDG